MSSKWQRPSAATAFATAAADALAPAASASPSRMISMIPSAIEDFIFLRNINFFAVFALYRNLNLSGSRWIPLAPAAPDNITVCLSI